MLAHSVVAAVSDRRRRSEIDATIRARGERRYNRMRRNLCRPVQIMRHSLECQRAHLSQTIVVE